MSRTQTKTDNISGQAPLPNFEAFAEANQSAINAISHVGADTMQRVLQINTQYLDFIRHRLDEDITTTKRIRDCGSMPEVIEAVTDFYKVAFDEYTKEMAELGEMTVTATTASLTEAEEETRKALKSED